MRKVEMNATAENRVKGMIELRDCVRTLIEYQTENYSDDEIKAQQAKLNTLYDNYTKKYGLINSRGNSLAFSEDSSYFLLCSLEILDAVSYTHLVCGYKVTTDKNVFYIRCDPRKNTYNAYIYCYDKQALQTYKDLKFVEQNYDAISKDKFYKTTNGVMEMYYNPDANAGGQFVELTISKDDILEAAKLYNCLLYTSSATS